MSASNDLIAAIATPPGRGGVGIIRVSGPNITSLANTLLDTCPAPRNATLLPFYDHDRDIIDEGIVLYFKAPHSFTGEDILELQGHGGPVILDTLLKRVLQLGARLARPGEFSERAFLNNKLDLTQAEAIADLIDAQSQQAARAAVRSLQGEFSGKIKTLLNELTQLRCYVEACIDFPEEEIDFLNDTQIQTRLTACINIVKTVLQQAQVGRIIKEGITIAILGPPNAGKSSLFNYFTRNPSAIVSDIPGTTRDIIKETVIIKNYSVNLLDTAGLRDNTEDLIEQEGIARAKAVLEKADLILFMVDFNDYQNNQLPKLFKTVKQSNVPVLLLINKIDLQQNHLDNKPETLFISVKHKVGLDLLETTLVETILPQQQLTEGNFIARRRHIDALQQTLTALTQGQTQLQSAKAGDLLAEELRLAQIALSSITGEFHSDDLLGEIFSNFCIGK